MRGSYTVYLHPPVVLIHAAVLVSAFETRLPAADVGLVSGILRNDISVSYGRTMRDKHISRENLIQKSRGRKASDYRSRSTTLRENCLNSQLLNACSDPSRDGRLVHKVQLDTLLLSNRPGLPQEI
jgi:hypothetical protein